MARKKKAATDGGAAPGAEKPKRKARAKRAPRAAGPRAGKLAEELVLTKAPECPPGSGPAMKVRYAKYKTGMTIGEALKKLGCEPRAIRWDLAHGLIRAA